MWLTICGAQPPDPHACWRTQGAPHKTAGLNQLSSMMPAGPGCSPLRLIEDGCLLPLFWEEHSLHGQSSEGEVCGYLGSKGHWILHEW